MAGNVQDADAGQVKRSHPGRLHALNAQDLARNAAGILSAGRANGRVVGHDGLEGLKLALNHKPDLIICDSVMPRMDGYGLMRALKANATTAGIPMILLTSKAGSEDEQKALGSGFLDFIAKPVQPIRVVSRVKRAFEIIGKIGH